MKILFIMTMGSENMKKCTLIESDNFCTHPITPGAVFVPSYQIVGISECQCTRKWPKHMQANEGKIPAGTDVGVWLYQR